MPVWRLATRLSVKAAVLLCLLWPLAACVTTTDRPQARVDLKKAEQTHIQAGLGYLRRRDKDSARRHFLKALDLNPSSAGAHNGLALVYQTEEDWQRADLHFRRALQADAGFSLARNNYAAFLYARDRFEDAEQQLLRVVEDYQYERRDLAYMNLGKTQARLGKIDSAVQSLRQAVGINARLALAHLELASIYFEQAQFGQARRYLGRFASLSRHTPRSLWLGIRVERHFGDKNREASYVLALKNLHPNSDEYRQYQQSLP